MPGTIDATDYDLFDYQNYDQEPLSLEEASRKASEMRRKDTQNVYRILPADHDMNGFYVTSVPVEVLRAELESKLLVHWARFVSAAKRLK